MTSILDFPTEILQLVFQFVDANSKQCIFQCQCVCRQWWLPAQKVAYSSLIIEHNHQIISLLKKLEDGNFQSVIPFVRAIRFSSFSNSNYVGIYLMQLSDSFPCIERVEMDYSNEKIYKNLITISKNRKWQRLKQIPTISCDKTITGYNYCALAFRESLTELNFHSYSYASLISTCMSPEEALQRTEDFRRLTRQLQSFSSVKQLQIRYHGSDFFVRFNKEFTIPPQLKSLCLDCYTDGVHISSSDRISTMVAWSNVTKLVGNFNFIDHTALECLLGTFTNIQTLALNQLNRSTTFENRAILFLPTNRELDSKCLSAFISYVSNIHTHQISLSIEHNLLVESIFQFLSTKSLTINPPSTQQLIIDLDGTVSRRNIGPIFSMRRNNGLKSEILIAYQLYDPNQRYLNFLQVNGPYIYNICLSTCSVFGPKACDNGIVLYNDCLNHTLQHCSNLHQIQLKSWIFEDYSQRNYKGHFINNTSISKLTISYTNVKNSVLGVLSEKLPNLRSLTLEHCDWSGSIVTPSSTFDNIIIHQRYTFNTMLLYINTRMKEIELYISLDFNTRSAYVKKTKTKRHVKQNDNSNDNSGKMYIYCNSVDQIQFRICSHKKWKDETPITFTITL